MRRFVLVCLVAATICAPCIAKLDPVGSNLMEPIENLLLPNDRTTVDDCHLRFYRFGLTGFAKPAFGRPAYLREFAHMAALGWTQADSTIKWSCGGSLILENWILTAAHCAADDTNKVPDVARFGDLDLYSDQDDEYAQQLSIVEVIRHPQHKFSARYHDIALMRLETGVKLHDTVAPGCLWHDNEVRFPSMEATGWGQTGYADAKTPILLKVSLSPVKLEECAQYYAGSERGLKKGLMDHQLCAGDIKMDTCPGDSGGPLQIKLLSNAKMTPFIVGVTSFGSACGQSTPGVYTRVSSYIGWIRKVLEDHGEKDMDWKMEPYACVLRYIHLREYEDDVVIGKSDGFESLDASKAHMSIESTHAEVKLQWNQMNHEGLSCTGVILDEDTVVTVAKCTTSRGQAPTHVLTVNDLRNDIVRIHKHPLYFEDSLYNNIALLKLRNRFNFSQSFSPACTWHYANLPDPQFEVSGIGRHDLNVFNRDVVESFKPENVSLLPRADFRPLDNCSYPEEFAARLNKGLQEEHLCFANKPFLVPTACEQNFGGPVQRYIYRFHRFFKHIYGINSFGRDCGFGEAAIATRLYGHTEWMKSVLLPNYYNPKDTIQFFNSDLHMGDSCVYGDGAAGRCVQTNRCPHVREDIIANKKVTFCSSGSLICCPNAYILPDTLSDAAKELDNCEMLYQQFHETVNDYSLFRPLPKTVPNLALVGWREGQSDDFPCAGSLITKDAIITTVSCITLKSTRPNIILLGPYESLKSQQQEMLIEEIIIHPEYAAGTKKNDIALIKLSKPAVPNNKIYPGCIWQNSTHTPIDLSQSYGTENSFTYQSAYPKYNSDCEKSFDSQISLNHSQICCDLETVEGCYYFGDPVYYLKQNKEKVVIQYLVGLVSQERCNTRNIMIFTKLSYFINWIKSVL